MSAFLVSTALANIIRHKIRSLLTIISIIIGIATVIATLAIGRGAQEKVRQKFESMGSNALSINPGSPQFTGMGNGRSCQSITEEDVAFLRSFDPRITHVAGFVRSKDVEFTYKNKKSSVPLTGTEPDALTIGNRTIKRGRNLLPGDLFTQAKVVVIGSEVAKELFGESDPVSKVVMIDKTPFTVVGVLTEKESPYAFYNVNKEAFMPLGTCKKMMKMNGSAIHTVSVSIDKDTDIKQVERLLKRAFRARHKLEAGTPEDFTIWNLASMMAAAEQSSQTLSLLILIVASLSLFVGGLGVSNLMLVTVSERTREIGIRMALGASPAVILWQFLIESILLCGIGGMMGALLGIGASKLIAMFVGWNVVVTPYSILINILITSLIGLFFGFWPARRAAKLTVVQALHDQ